MKNAAEMALAEFKNPNIQLLVKDAAGTPQGAQQGAQQAIAEGAEIIIGPLFAQSVSAAGQLARPRGIPMIAFSTDANVAARGVYLLSFLPESDVHRIVDYAVTHGKRSFAALVPSNAYGAVVEAAFQQAVARRGGRVVGLERYSLSPPSFQEPARRLAQGAARADTIFIPDNADNVPQVVSALAAAGVNLKRVQLLGTGLWDEPRIFSNQALSGAWYAAPDPPASAASRNATADVTGKTRFAPRRCPMMQSRLLPRCPDKGQARSPNRR
jgi:ABC-type branched-subunit amino acid transport system substrate-binding protein